MRHVTFLPHHNNVKSNISPLHYPREGTTRLLYLYNNGCVVGILQAIASYETVSSLANLQVSSGM
eukprot:1770665-Ditylum_brightwellii.AAC.1